MAEMESVVVLKPVVSRLQPEHALTAFTDYSQWERRPTRTSSTLGTPLPKVQSPKTSLTVRASPSPAIRQPVCKHGSNTKHTPSLQPPKSGLRPISTRSERGPRLSRPKTREPSSVQLLKLQVVARKSSVEDYKKYKQELLANNLSVIASIEQAEEKTHGSVNELLEKYQKFKGAISTLKQKSAESLKCAREELEEFRLKLQREIEVLREQVSTTDATLQAKSRELQTLFHYKDKEYPIKMVRIEQLKEQIELMNERNENEIVELEAEIAEERQRYEQQMEDMRMRMEATAAEASLSAMKRSVQQKAMHNKIMEKEILIHKERQIELENDVRTLKAKIKHLKQNMKKSNRHPLCSQPKCLPDMELHLNIPVQEHLPV